MPSFAFSRFIEANVSIEEKVRKTANGSIFPAIWEVLGISHFEILLGRVMDQFCRLCFWIDDHWTTADRDYIFDVVKAFFVEF